MFGVDLWSKAKPVNIKRVTGDRDVRMRVNTRCDSEAVGGSGAFRSTSEPPVGGAGRYDWRKAAAESPRWVIVPAAKQLRLSFITAACFPALELPNEKQKVTSVRHRRVQTLTDSRLDGS